MRRRIRCLLVPFAAASAIAAVAIPASAQAPNPEINVFEIEAHTVYCQHGGSACVQPSGSISGLHFADATVWRFSPLSAQQQIGRQFAFGRPELVHAVCATHYRDAAGDVHARAIDFTGTSLSVPGAESAHISGAAAVAKGSESSKHAVGAINVKATASNGDQARIIGVHVANNTNDSRVLGGFRINVKGTIVDTNFVTGKTTTVGHGRMSCSTDVTPVTAPFSGPAPNTFSSEIKDTGDPS